MATTTKTSNTQKKAPAKPRTEPAEPKVAFVEKEETPVVVKEVNPHQYVTVRNGFHGKLIYKSKKTGQTFTWDDYGSEQEMELIELKDAKNTSKKMFINNWFMFDEDWIVEYLGLRQYYKNAISIEEFDGIFNKSPEELKDIINDMSEGQKRSTAYRARVLINEGTIDSRKVITALEEALHTELIER